MQPQSDVNSLFKDFCLENNWKEGERKKKKKRGGERQTDRQTELSSISFPRAKD